jgi:hypothetical protein
LPLSINGHTVQSELNPRIVSAEQVSASDIILDTGNVGEPNVGVDGTFMRQGAVGVSNSYIGGETSSPSSNGFSANVDILNLQQIPLLSLEPLTTTFVQSHSLEGPNVLSVVTASLGESENQDNHSTLQRESSMSSSSATLSRHR